MNSNAFRAENNSSDLSEIESRPLRLVASESEPSTDEIEVDTAHDWALFPDGEYEACFIKQEIVNMKMFKGESRLYAHFEILNFGDTTRKKIYGAWSIKVSSKGGKRRISAGGRSRLYIMLCRIYNYRVRPDRISFHGLRGCVLKIRTRTVKKNFQQRELPECLWYSVVDDIIGIEAGSS